MTSRRAHKEKLLASLLNGHDLKRLKDAGLNISVEKEASISGLEPKNDLSLISLLERSQSIDLSNQEEISNRSAQREMQHTERLPVSSQQENGNVDLQRQKSSNEIFYSQTHRRREDTLFENGDLRDLVLPLFSSERVLDEHPAVLATLLEKVPRSEVNQLLKGMSGRQARRVIRLLRKAIQ